MAYPRPPRVLHRPRWAQQLAANYRGGIAQQFVLHFNITDFVVDLDDERAAPEYGRFERAPTGNVVGQPRPFREYLGDLLFARTEAGGFGCQSIYAYSLADGLQVQVPSDHVAPAAWQRVWDAIAAVREPQHRRRPGPGATPPARQGEETDLPELPADNLKILAEILRRQYGAWGGPRRPNEEEAPVAVIVEFAEKLIPYRLGEGQGDREQMQSMETVQRWALDPEIRGTGNLVILLTTNVGQIPSSLYAGGSGCREIRLALPTFDERRAYILWHMGNPPFPREIAADISPPGNPEAQARVLARMTQGLRLSDVDGMGRRIIVEAARDHQPERLTAAHVQREKSEVVRAQSEQLLEILRPARGFDAIGGMQKLKAYLADRTGQMRLQRHTPLVPNGLLLAGPPGTGKTIIAEALAKESGFNLVKMRNIREKWVGSSERNLDLVINLLQDLHPVIVFIDEVDQAIGQRDTGQSGDSGVGARMFGRILEVMSEPTNRGKILWVAASNRADVLDDAMIRRFDRVVPLLPPDVDEAVRVFEIMPETIRQQSDNTVNVAYSEGLRRRGFRDVAQAVVDRGLTGSGIEIVVRRAAEIACERMLERQQPLDDQNLPAIEQEHLTEALEDYEPNHNVKMYDFQSLLAIRACNFRSVRPEPLSKHLRELIWGPGARPGAAMDRDRLDAAIRKLAEELYAERRVR